MSDNNADGPELRAELERARRQWDAVFCNVLAKAGDVDSAIDTADKAAPLHAAERRRWIEQGRERRYRAWRRELWLRSRPYRKTNKKPIDEHRMTTWAVLGRRLARIRRGEG